MIEFPLNIDVPPIFSMFQEMHLIWITELYLELSKIVGMPSKM